MIRKKGLMLCCIPLQYLWLVTHVFNDIFIVTMMSSNEWSQKMRNLTEHWHAKKLDVEKVTVSCVIFQMYPSKGPMEGEPNNEAPKGFVLHGIGVGDLDMLQRIIRSWDEVNKKGNGKKTVGCKWVKYNSYGSIERYKARLVAKGFTQTYEVYMDMPPGFEDKFGSNVCKQNKSLYGLKKSPRTWFEKFTQSMTKQGYIQGQANHTLFTKFSPNEKVVVLIVYVDDIVLTGDDMYS
ncbi:pentatricopeptide repeat-containing protein mitochondrial-like [Trifolium pratense]|uniref:Pentatricopeptide repeat-containing protein mitochondrial-like n=1 Tax=Trifolium pratense TaxID=57577 RepID=A0A2K3MRC3_TRIPR|nr:pentatricopeptide repeat-containing protein mitochondrial-like [Trifolium pratense]